VEHIVPVSTGGTDEKDNLAYACSGCNGHKFTKSVAWDAVSEQFAPLFNPRKQVWEAHFRWDETATVIIGQTPSGRATVEALHLNRVALLNLRHGMVLLGIHPPG